MDYPVISGIKTIQRPDDAIITRKYAKHLFKDENPLGKQLVSSAGYTLTIRGIVDEPDTKSSLQFDLITPVNQGKYMDWSRMGFCITRLVKGTELAKFNEKISKPQSLICFSHSPIQFRLFPLKELYFNKVVSSASGFFLRGNKEHVIVLSVVACMLLLVGIFNFINIWNEYFLSLIFANNDTLRPVAVGLYGMLQSMQYTGNWAGMFAAVVIVFLPTFILYLFLSEKIIGGVTGGIKG